MKPPEPSLRQDIANVVRGFFMGGADVVPGVSGGTVALILGIYERLVAAISHFDLTLLGHIQRRRFREAANHVDLRLLVALGVGIAGGFLVMTMLMNRLLNQPTSRALTFAAFFGLIGGSAIIVALLIQVRSKAMAAACLALGVVGAIFAYGLTTLTASVEEPSYLYVFCCAAVAICAMILPGISGAMVLLILGVYVHLTEIPHSLAHGEKVVESLLMVATFLMGASIGLILFSKFLRWQLLHFHAYTMAVLCGFMVGALPKLWPFQRDLTPEIEKFKLKEFERILPPLWDSTTIMAILIGFSAMALVLVVDWVARGRRVVVHDASS